MGLKHLIGAMAAAGLATAAQAGNVDVTVDGVRAGGTLYVALQQRAQFLSEVDAYSQKVENPTAGTVSVTFHDVVPGEYSVNVWHDDDGNGRFDTQPDGPPLDGWSLVNADALTGMPSFDQVKTTIGAEGSAVPLAMRYGRPATD